VPLGPSVKRGVERPYRGAIEARLAHASVEPEPRNQANSVRAERRNREVPGQASRPPASPPPHTGRGTVGRPRAGPTAEDSGRYVHLDVSVTLKKQMRDHVDARPRWNGQSGVVSVWH
jgi:hypothetical protein